MTLAEALIYRKELNNNNSRLTLRIAQNTVVSEGTHPQEDPLKLLSQLRENYLKLTNLIASINYTNVLTKVGDKSLADALAYRKVLENKISDLTTIRQASYVTNRGKKKDDLKDVVLIDVSQLTKEINSLSIEHRKLNAEIQKINWITELQEVEL